MDEALAMPFSLSKYCLEQSDLSGRNGKVRRMDRDFAVWRHGLRNPHVASDNRMVADSHIAQDGCLRIHGDIILQIRMPLVAFDEFSTGVLRKTERTKRDPLIQLDP